MRKKFVPIILFTAVIIAATFPATRIPVVQSANFVGQTIYLRADGSIEPISAPIDVHGNIYTLTGDIQCPRIGYCIFIERSGVILEGNGYTIEGWVSDNGQRGLGYAIYAGFVSNVEIHNIVIKGCSNGIETQSVSGVGIHNTTIDGLIQGKNSEATGIDVMYCEGVTLDQNCILNNYLGILVQSSNCTIKNNQIMHNAGGGITLAGSGNILTSNLIAYNDQGVEIQSSNNVLQNNDVVKNKRIGILIGSPNNLFVGNNIVGQNSTDAHGIQMGPYESGNTFYHNDFENNYFHVEGGDYASIANVWDNSYPSGGNFWDTYLGLDNFRGVYQNETGSDGIGDASYQITMANVDRYPLIQPIKSNPYINEESKTPTDNSLAIVLAVVAALCSIFIPISVFWKRKKKGENKEKVPNKKNILICGSSVTILLTLSFLIIINFTFIASGNYQLGSVELFGGALYFDEILIGFLSSIIGLFLTWKVVMKQKYSAHVLREFFSAVLIVILFVSYLLAYSAYRQFELFGLLQYIQPTLVMVWTFVTTLIGCLLGFWLGRLALKRLQSTPTLVELEKKSKISFLGKTGWMITIFAGLITGYAIGYISWFALGQTQIALGETFSYASIYPPSIAYLLGWGITGALVISIGIMLIRRA